MPISPPLGRFDLFFRSNLIQRWPEAFGDVILPAAIGVEVGVIVARVRIASQVVHVEQIACNAPAVMLIDAGTAILDIGPGLRNRVGDRAAQNRALTILASCPVS